MTWVEKNGTQALLGDEALSMQRLEGSSRIVMIPAPTSITAAGLACRTEGTRRGKSAVGLMKGTGLLLLVHWPVCL